MKREEARADNSIFTLKLVKCDLQNVFFSWVEFTEESIEKRLFLCCEEKQKCRLILITSQIGRLTWGWDRGKGFLISQHISLSETTFTEGEATLLH